MLEFVQSYTAASLAIGALLFVALLRLLTVGTKALVAAVKSNLDAVVFAVHESIRELRDAISQLREEIRANREYTVEVMSQHLEKISGLDRRLTKIEGEHCVYHGDDRRRDSED